MLIYSKDKTAVAIKKVDEAIKRMIKNKETINFNSVAAEAKVSKGFLYKQQSTRKRIEILRKQQEGIPSPKDIKREMTDNSKDVLIASLRKKVKELEDENKDLKERLKQKFGELYEKI